MRKLCDASDIIQAHLIRHALEAEGIPAHVQGEHLLGGVGQLPATGLLAIWVPEASLPLATGVLESLPLWQGQPGDEDADVPAWNAGPAWGGGASC